MGNNKNELGVFQSSYLVAFPPIVLLAAGAALRSASALCTGTETPARRCMHRIHHLARFVRLGGRA